ncbi:MAG: primosomal protein N', partial [Saprospiraceae bacterium]|nr:primosomal protein N' [Saprospiraceae bacterium]
GKLLRQSMGERVLGPVLPQVPRIRNYYGQQILLKLEKSAPVIRSAKDLIRQATETVTAKAGWSQLRVAVDVDPV